jgi:D-alanyl-D-alanine carboxypeptidase (penicillin-binding protein 5/6)
MGSPTLRRLALLATALLLSASAALGLEAPPAEPATPSRTTAAAAAPQAGAPQVVGQAYLVQNGTTGEILARSRDRERLPIASITKLMTVLVALQHARLDDQVTVSRSAAAVGGSTIYLRAGEQLTVRDLVQGALIQSANDAAVALAEHVGGSQAAFVEMMNAEAARLRLRDTRFVNPNGLDAAGHYSSARDVTRLARIAMKNPVIRAVVAQPTATIAGGRTLHTWNDLLGRFPGTFGVKTGHTAAAGWSEVAAAQVRGVTVYATLLGAPTREGRNVDLQELLAWGISRYRTVNVIAVERVYATAEAPYGRRPLGLVASGRVARIVRVDRPLVEHVVAPTVVSLPVRKGQALGEVRVYAGPKLIARRPLVATRDVARPGVVGRTEWYAGRTLDHVAGWFS